MISIKIDLIRKQMIAKVIDLMKCWTLQNITPYKNSTENSFFSSIKEGLRFFMKGKDMEDQKN